MGEQEKKITPTPKTDPPPIEVHLKNEDYELMTVIPFCSVSLSLLHNLEFKILLCYGQFI